MCFQRFSLENWGYMSKFKSCGEGKYTLSLPGSVDSLVEILVDEENKLRGHFGLKGRATHVLHANSHSIDPHDVNKSLNDRDLVAKVYWPEVSRITEVEIIEAAQLIGKTNPDVKDHIPVIISSLDLEQYSTDKIRRMLGIWIDPKGSQLLRVIMFPRLFPITELTGISFWTAFWQCFRCKSILLC
jgi:hypothetical protein